MKFHLRNLQYLIYSIALCKILTKQEFNFPDNAKEDKTIQIPNIPPDDLTNITCPLQCSLIGGSCISNNIDIIKSYGQIENPLKKRSLENRYSCICRENYTTVFNENLPKRFCNHKRKSSRVALIFELFIGFGAGHFYSGRMVNGIVKCLSFLVLVCKFYSLSSIYFKFIDENPNLIESFFTSYLRSLLNTICGIISVWQVFDIILFGLNLYSDGFGADMS